MCHMLFELLMPTLLSAALAQDNNAEKVFHAMENKIVEAKALRFAVNIVTRGDTKDSVGRFTCSFLLTSDNQARLKFSGTNSGERRQWEMISDGKRVYLKPFGLGATETSKEEETVATPEKLHDLLARRVSQLGVQPIMNPAVPVFQAAGSEPKIDLWDFTAGDSDKVDDRDAKVVRYQAGQKELSQSMAFTLWIDNATGLPLKRVMVAKTHTVTETYSEFTLDPKIDPKMFELPKAAVRPQENIPIEKLPKAVTETVKKRFPKTELRSAVFARPGSEWLGPGEKRELYLLDLKNGNLHIALWVTPVGAITEIVNEITAAQLTKEVKDYLDKNYPGQRVAEVNELFKVNEDKETLDSVKVFLSADNRTRVLVFSAEGKFLKEDK